MSKPPISIRIGAHGTEGMIGITSPRPESRGDLSVSLDYLRRTLLAKFFFEPFPQSIPGVTSRNRAIPRYAELCFNEPSIDVRDPNDPLRHEMITWLPTRGLEFAEKLQEEGHPVDFRPYVYPESEFRLVLFRQHLQPGLQELIRLDPITEALEARPFTVVQSESGRLAVAQTEVALPHAA